MLNIFELHCGSDGLERFANYGNVCIFLGQICKFFRPASAVEGAKQNSSKRPEGVVNMTSSTYGYKKDVRSGFQVPVQNGFGAVYNLRRKRNNVQKNAAFTVGIHIFGHFLRKLMIFHK
jgi:hypothetical protein